MKNSARPSRVSTQRQGALRFAPLLGQVFAVLGAVRALRAVRSGGRLQQVDAVLTALSVVSGLVIVLRGVKDGVED